MLNQYLKPGFLIIIILLNYGCANLNPEWLLQSYDDMQAAQIEQVEIKADSLLNQGKALETLKLINNTEIPVEEFQKHYPMAINLLIEQAAMNFREEHPATAGNLYRQALNWYPADQSLQAGIIQSSTQIEDQMNRCADRLLENGLIAYRNGQLQQAIDIWSQIKQFHPTYKASQQAILTTQKQIKNLEQFKNPEQSLSRQKPALH